MENSWGTPDGSGVEFCTPSLIGDETAREWYARYWRSAVSPGAALDLLEVNTEIDIRSSSGSLETRSSAPGTASWPRSTVRPAASAAPWPSATVHDGWGSACEPVYIRAS